MPYNLTNMSQNTTGILSLTQNVNDTLMLGWLGTLFLIGVTVIILTSFIFSTNDVKRSVAATAFLSFALCLFLRAISLVPDTAIYVTLICSAAALAFSWKR
jgi:hypothetical protein